jgi:hypothetical protein
VYVDRSFPEQNSANKPLTPVAATTQKKAIELLNKYLFAPNAFDADAQIFPYMQLQRRGYNFFGNPEDPRIETSVLSLQLNTLSYLLFSTTTTRINNSGLYGNTYSVADVMTDLTKGIFDADKGGAVNLYRQNLQTEYVKGLATIKDAAGYDNATKAAALNSLKKIKTLLATAVSPNEQTRAHRVQLNYLIDKALSVK